MQWLYQLSVKFYHLAIRVAALFSPKARKWIKGRKKIWVSLEAEAAKSNQWILFHAASLGEFEQGRPLIEAIKQKYHDYAILLTFFSPSGYEIRKNYTHADCVSYLPADSPQNAIKLLNTFNPKAVFFIKYEFWYNYLQKIYLKQIPLFYISLKLRPDQYFFKSYGKWFREQLQAVSHFFVQDLETLDLLRGAGFLNATVTGDTRFDRVAAIAKKAKRFPTIEKFLGNSPCVIWGSTWPADEKLIIPILQKLPENYKSIIVPHDVSSKHIQQLALQLGADHQKWSDFNAENASKVLIIDSIGMLSHLYRYAKVAYVGGGFGKQIHNIQEPITFGCPVILGPKHTKFSEATDLIELGGAFAIKDVVGLESTLTMLLQDEVTRGNASRICLDYVSSQTGATDSIMQKIEQHFKVF